MSAAFIPLASTVARWFTKRRGMMTGITASGLAVGTLIMPLVANWLITGYGWRTSYAIVGGMSVIGITLLAQFLKRNPQKAEDAPIQEDKPIGY